MRERPTNSNHLKTSSNQVSKEICIQCKRSGK